MTIWDERLRIPESTKDAIRLARLCGNKVFINTGRSRSNTRYEALEELGMDGVVAACGCHIDSIVTAFCPWVMSWYAKRADMRLAFFGSLLASRIACWNSSSST